MNNEMKETLQAALTALLIIIGMGAASVMWIGVIYLTHKLF